MSPAKDIVKNTVGEAVEAVIEHPGRANLFALYLLLSANLLLSFFNTYQQNTDSDRLTKIETLFGNGSVIELRVRVLVLEREIAVIRRSHDTNGAHKGD